MAKKWKVWIDKKDFSENVLKADFMEEAIRKEAETIRNRCGDGYAAAVSVGEKRTIGRVYPETREAKRDNYANNTLLKAVKNHG